MTLLGLQVCLPSSNDPTVPSSTASTCEVGVSPEQALQAGEDILPVPALGPSLPLTVI